MPAVAEKHLGQTDLNSVRIIINNLISIKKRAMELCSQAQDEINKVLRKEHTDIDEYLQVEKEKFEDVINDDSVHIIILTGILEDIK